MKMTHERRNGGGRTFGIAIVTKTVTVGEATDDCTKSSIPTVSVSVPEAHAHAALLLLRFMHGVDRHGAVRSPPVVRLYGAGAAVKARVEVAVPDFPEQRMNALYALSSGFDPDMLVTSHSRDQLKVVFEGAVPRTLAESFYKLVEQLRTAKVKFYASGDAPSRRRYLGSVDARRIEADLSGTRVRRVA